MYTHVVVGLDKWLVETASKVGQVPAGADGVAHVALARGVSAEEALRTGQESFGARRGVGPDEAQLALGQAERDLRAIDNLDADRARVVGHVAGVRRGLMGVADGQKAAGRVEVLPDLLAGLETQEGPILRPAETNADAAHVRRRAHQTQCAAL